MECLKRALSKHKPEIINSDQGSHFTNSDYIKLMEAAKIKNMNGWQEAGFGQYRNRTDSFRTLKYDLIYINEFESPKELRKAINSYIHEYNTNRPHSSIGDLCPALRFIMAGCPSCLIIYQARKGNWQKSIFRVLTMRHYTGPYFKRAMKMAGMNGII